MASNGVVIIDLPVNASVKVDGFSNSGSWKQQIIVAPSGGTAVTWTGEGQQSNKLIGQTIIAKGAAKQLKVQMQHNPGSGWKPSQVEAVPFEAPGLAGYVIGGQDSGGRPYGPAFHNTIAFVYWSPGY